LNCVETNLPCLGFYPFFVFFRSGDGDFLQKYCKNVENYIYKNALYNSSVLFCNSVSLCKIKTNISVVTWKKVSMLYVALLFSLHKLTDYAAPHSPPHSHKPVKTRSDLTAPVHKACFQKFQSQFKSKS
jgi:hypothetical protein